MIEASERSNCLRLVRWRNDADRPQLTKRVLRVAFEAVPP